jgi:hypothetical protein
MFWQSGMNFFGSPPTEWVDIELVPKQSLFGAYSFFFLLLSLFLVVLAKNANTKSFEIVFQLFFKPRKTDIRIKESWPVFGRASWFLAINFFITLAHSLYLLLQNQGVKESFSLIFISLGIAASFFFLAFISMFLIRLLAGMKKAYQTPMQLTWVLPQFVGLLLFIVNLIWVLNPIFSSQLIFLFLLFFALLSVQRVLRSTYFLLTNGVEWYYILLYFCTLEIMPLSILVWFLYKWIVG